MIYPFQKEKLAIVGGNGTGKSTLLKIIAGFISPTTGALQRKENIQIGYVPEHFPEGIRFTLEDYLFHLGHIHGLSTKYVKDKIPMLLNLFIYIMQDILLYETFQRA